jgi:hypothetical protein
MNNSPAFPQQFKGTTEPSLMGLTMRDYFAAKAMHSLYVSLYEYEFTGNPKTPEFVALMDELAIDAYQMADSMMKAREA